ncbi:MAG: lipopolysaccharide biosynthesis protein, partial [Pedobacter sp.]
MLRFQEWYRFLLSKWLVILTIGLIGGILGFTYAYFKKPYYIATTSFVLEESGSASSSLGGLGGLASMVGVDIGGGGGGIFQGDNILELYKSRAMIEKTLLTEIVVDNKKQLLVDVYISFNDLRNEWDNSELRNIHIKASSASNRLQDSLLGVIVSDINKNYLTVSKPDKKLSIIKADVTA